MTKGDKLLIGIVIIISLIGLFYNYSKLKDRANLTLNIEVNGEAYREIKLNEDTYEIIEIKTEYGRNVVEIEGESVKVIEADCPDQLDVKQGAIDKPGQAIICLPNRLVLELKSSSNTNEIDKMVQ